MGVLRTVKLKLQEGIRSWLAYAGHVREPKDEQGPEERVRRTSRTSRRRLQAARRGKERGAKRAIWEPGDRFADWMRRRGHKSRLERPRK